MKVTSSKPKGQKIKKTTKGKQKPFCIEPIGSSWWFSTETGEWYNGYKNVPEGGMSSSYYFMTYDGFNDIYSLKAAKRKIAKWNVPKGTKFKVGLPWIGYYYIITK